MDCEEKKETICLVVVFYSGERVGNQQKDYSKYIEAHKESLIRFGHNLQKIFFVFNKDDHVGGLVFEERVTSDTYDNITYVYRKNTGNMSFSAWAEICAFFKEEFDYYIFAEDDYVFVKDDFDKILASEHERGGADYTVNWIERPTKDISLPKERVALLEANERMDWGGRLTSTCGIMSSRFYMENQEFFDNFDYMASAYNTDASKGRSMACFLNKLKSIKGLPYEYNCFPYWSYDANKVNIYSYDDSIGEEENKNRITMCCYQYYNEHVRNKKP